MDLKCCVEFSFISMHNFTLQRPINKRLVMPNWLKTNTKIKLIQADGGNLTLISTCVSHQIFTFQFSNYYLAP